MAHLDPNEAFEHLRDRVVDGIKTHFPIQGKMQSLHLDKLEVKNDLHPDDIRGQHNAKVKGESWSEPVYAHLSLKNNETGKVIDQRRIRVAEVPRLTKRYSYIVDGQEYQIDNQWQLQPGVYTRRRQNGDLESRFNVTSGRAFDLLFDPASKQFFMEYGKASLPLYPIMKTMGVDDDALEKSWGKEILQANKSARGAAGAVERFYKSDKKTGAPSKEVAEEHLVRALTNSELRPGATQLTLGKAFNRVSGETLHLATEKILKVQGGHPEDDRDSLVFKDLRTAGDFAHDKLRAAGRVIQLKSARKINQANDIRDVIKFDLFNEPIKHTFHKNSAARVASQINPVEMVSSALQTTIMGPGGIQSEQSVTDEAKFVNPSHLGFLDPINTPEGEKTGITLRLPIGVKKVGNEPRVPLYSLKTGKVELVSPGDFHRSKVVLPDQVKWEGNKPKPISPSIRLAGGGEIREGKFEDAQYVMRHPSQLFNITANLIPFLGNTSGNRAGMASRHIEQAISLVHREAPLVQVATGVDKHGIETFENLVGRQAAHFAPVDGVVHEVKKDAVVIQDKGGKKHEVTLYRNYPLNDTKSVMDSVTHVKAGDAVKAGQVIGDTNYAKNGTLALGTNLRVGYVPFKGYNFEDGIVISDSAAQKLTSTHLHKNNLQLEDNVVLSPRKFAIEHPGAFKKDQYEKLGDDGVVRIGQKVKPGDPLIVAMKPYQLKDRQGLGAIRRSLSGAHTDKSMRWDSDHDGEVVDVHRTKDGITVHVRTQEPMQVGDKLAGRYGNKGIVTMILPDHEMPHSKDGKHIEVALNPSGVPGRMNIGQVLETAASKIAQKTGKPYIVKNFEPNVDFLERVKKELKDHGISDTEELHDPVTKQNLGHALVGPQHMLKLVHQVDKKLSVRSGMSGLPGVPGQEHYDLNLQPTSGSGTGGQSMGVLGMFAMLAHGSKANIREMQTWKSEGPDPQASDAKRWPSQHSQVWTAIQTGMPLPTPTPTFAFKKFEEMLRGTGINLEKKGHQFTLSPLTDKQILSMSAGALPKPAELLFAKPDKNGDPKPKPGGLFDEKLTGGHGGRKWSHISLAEPMPNPSFELPIRHLTGLSQKEFSDILHGDKAVAANGQIVSLGAGITGGAAIKQLLDQIDVKKELAKSKKELAGAPASKADKVLKKAKYLQALDHLNLKPSEAYVLHHLPVLPPVMRPVSTLPSGDYKYADLNGLYSEFSQVNDKLKDPTLAKHLPDEAKKQLRQNLYDGLKAVMGLGVPYADATQKGIIHQISGSQPKTGYFQNVLMNRRQDLTMRSTIVPEPALGLDEVGLPKHAALDLFRPFVVRQLVQMGAAPTPLDAQKELTKKSPAVWRALDKVLEDRPVLLKRDPALHKHSVQAFKGRVVSGNAIQIHPLVTGGYNADFDGDTMSVFVPIHHEAVAEARKMFPSNNLFSEATGKVMYQPTLESALGLYKLSVVGKDSGKKFSHPGEALDAVRDGKLHVTDLVHVDGQKTTAGRILLSTALPQPMQKKVLEDHSFVINKKGLDSLLTDLAKNHGPDFGHAVNKLKDIGNGASFGAVALPHPENKGMDSLDPKNRVFIPIGTHTLSLDDFTPDKKTREHVLSGARKKVDDIYTSTSIHKNDKDRRAILVWQEADQKMKELHEKDASHSPDNLFTMYQAGVKPGWEQYKQMKIAPMLMTDSANRIIPTPITKSYAEGLGLSDYWIGMHGARRGAVMKVQEVQEPGYMSKLLMNNMMHLLVNAPDCGTDKGVALSADEKDVHDRHLAQDFRAGNLHIPAGSVLTPDLVGKIRSTKKDAQVVVRSPLKCEDEKGICQKCIGLSATGHSHGLGTNIGVLSAHAVGERAIQLTLKAFHTGGVQEGGKNLLNSFARFQQLTMLPRKIPNSAALALRSGKVEKIQQDPTGVKVWVDGTSHHIPKDPSGMPLHEELPHMSKSPGYQAWDPPKVGMHVEAGQHLSDPNRTLVNPHTLYEATGSIEKVQNHLTNEIYDLYKGEGIRRRAVEVVVKAMSNLTKVQDPGDHDDVMRGEFRPTSVVKRINADLVKQGKKPIEHSPVLKGVEMAPLSLHEDWMAKLQHQRLRDTLLEAAASHGSAHIHGPHPVPGIAYGAEFGLTSKDSLRPGMGHLANVPAHHY